MNKKEQRVINVVAKIKLEQNASNNGDKEAGNISSLKKTPNNEAYISAQSLRYNMRRGIILNDDTASPSLAPGYDPQKDVSSDIFGFMDAEGKRKRTGALEATPIKALRPGGFDHDMVVHYRIDSKNAIANPEYHGGGEYCHKTSFNLTNLSSETSFVIENRSAIKRRSIKFVDEKERKRRAELYLDSIQYLNGFANQARFSNSYEPEEVFIVFDTKNSKMIYKAFEEGVDSVYVKNVISDIEARGGKVFYGNIRDAKKSVSKAFNDANNYLNSKECVFAGHDYEQMDFENYKTLKSDQVDAEGLAKAELKKAKEDKAKPKPSKK